MLYSPHLNQHVYVGTDGLGVETRFMSLLYYLPSWEYNISPTQSDDTLSDWILDKVVGRCDDKLTDKRQMNDNCAIHSRATK